jgi:hypothetical protein
LRIHHAELFLGLGVALLSGGESIFERSGHAWGSEKREREDTVVHGLTDAPVA